MIKVLKFQIIFFIFFFNVKLFSYVEIVISGLRLYNFSFIDDWSPLPIETADRETNTPRKTETMAIFIIRDDILLLSLLEFNFLYMKKI